MKEQIKILANTPATILVFNAMSAMPGDIIKNFNLEANGDASLATIEVKVNGVEVPFTTVLDAAIKQMLDSWAVSVKEEALELIQKHPALCDLYNAMEDAQYRITNAIKALPEE